MHPRIRTATTLLGLTVLALILAAALPLGGFKRPVLGGAVLLFGLGCLWLVAMACKHGHIPFRGEVYHSAHDRFYFWFYLTAYIAVGLLAILGGTHGLMVPA